MLSFDSWRKDKIHFGELPTVRDVLAAADPALVADALRPRHARLAASEGGEPPALSEVWADFEQKCNSLHFWSRLVCRATIWG